MLGLYTHVITVVAFSCSAVMYRTSELTAEIVRGEVETSRISKFLPPLAYPASKIYFTQWLNFL